MGKYFFWGFIILVLIIGFINAYQSLSGQIKTTSLFKLFEWEAPSYYNQGKPSLKVIDKRVLPESNSSLSQKNTVNNSPPKTEKKINPPAGFSENDLSPYYGLVKIRYINPGFSSMGTVNIYAAYNLQEPINITGWRLRSNTGDMIIPGAVEDYEYNKIKEESDIYLTQNGKVNIYNWVSGNGKNLRLNKCIGYLNGIYNFKPQLPCSYIKLFDRNEIAEFSGECQNYILSLRSCKSPTPHELNSFSKEPKCRYFLDRFSYEGCYKLQRNSSDFFKNEWYIWIPGFWNFNKEHDRVLLLDKKGLLVDIYVY